MTQKTISVTRALVELKRLNERIASAILNGKFVSRTVGRGTSQKMATTNDSIEQAKSKIQASFDTVDSLITERQKIKSAIVMANATNKVTVLGTEMSVAEAIDLKGTVSFRTQYLTAMKMQFVQESKAVENANNELNAMINAMLTTIYGSDKKVVDSSTLEMVSTPQYVQREAALLDPMKIEDKIKKIADDIQALESELDFTLSEANARMTITV